MGRVKIKFDPDAFTDVFYKIEPVNSRFLLIYGSAASSKSVSVAQRTIIKCLKKKKKVLYIRKVASTVKDSIFSEVKKWLTEWYLASFFKATMSPTTIYLKNGSEILFRGLDDPEKLKSISDIDEIIIEEGTELTKHDFFELNRRLRGKEEMQITLLFNPIDESHWIKQHFFDQHVPDTTIVHVTYNDNKFISTEDIRQLEEMKLYDPVQYEVYCLGKWGNLRTGSEFFPAFNEAKHTGKVKYLPHLPIHQSWDFNSSPYQPMALFQIAEGVKRWENPINKVRYDYEVPGSVPVVVTQIRAFKEYAFKSPINDIDNVCLSFDDGFKAYEPDVLIYGDASGKNKIPGSGDGTNFKRVKARLTKYLSSGSDRVPSSNPSVMKSRDFVNKVFANMYPIEFVADKDNCPLLIQDLAKVQLTQNGMAKTVERDPVNKAISYQKYGHFSDICRYIIVSVFNDFYKTNL